MTRLLILTSVALAGCGEPKPDTMTPWIEAHPVAAVFYLACAVVFIWWVGRDG